MINLQDIIVRRGTKVVLDAASITIHPGEKAALIGRNGAGKSTLFSLLTGGLIEDGGRFSFPKSWRISQVEQHMPKPIRRQPTTYWPATPCWQKHKRHWTPQT